MTTTEDVDRVTRELDKLVNILTSKVIHVPTTDKGTRVEYISLTIEPPVSDSLYTHQVFRGPRADVEKEIEKYKARWHSMGYNTTVTRRDFSNDGMYLSATVRRLNSCE